jgi:hypothetical protein
MNTFAGSVEQLRGAIETASIAVGRVFLPVLRSIVDALTVVVNAFNRMPRSVQAVTGVAIAAAAALAGIAGAMVLAGPRAGEFAKSLRLIRTALLGTNPLLLAIVGGIALLGLAYKTNFGGIADIVDHAIDRLREFGRVVARSFNFSRSLPDIGNLGAAFAALGQAMTEVLGVNVYKQFRAIGKAADRFGLSLGRMRRQIGVLGRAFQRGGLQEGFNQLFGKVGRNLLAEFGDAMATLPRTVGTALRQITTGIGPLDRLFKNLGSSLQQFGRFVENVFAGNFDKALVNLQNIGKRLKAGAIDISGIVVRVVSWAVQEGVSLATAVYDFVTTDLWPRIKSTATDVFDAAVNVASWAIAASGDLLGDVTTYITDTAWPAVKDTATDIAGAVVNIASWSVRAASGIWDAVSAVAVKAWNLVKHIAIGIPDALIAVKNFVVSLGDSVWGAIGGAVRSAWNLVKDTAIGIKDVALSVTSWITNQIKAGTLIDSVRAFVEETLATLNVTINDWKLTVGAPDDSGITVDVGAIWDKIWNDIINPTFTPEQVQAAEDAGSNIGAEAVKLLVKGIKAAFGLGGKVGGGGGGEQLTGKDIVGQFIKGFFVGAFGEALGVGADLSEQARTWASNTRDAIVKAIRDVFTGTTQVQGGPGGDFAGATIVEKSGIFDGLLDALKLPDIPTPTLPDWLTNTGWLTAPIKTLTDAITRATQPLQKAWDLYKSIADLFAGANNGTNRDEQNGGIFKDSDGDGVPDSLDKKEGFFSGGIKIGEALGDGIATGVGHKKPDIAAALQAATSGSTQSGATAKAGGALTDFAADIPKPITIPAPDLSALVKGFATAVKVTTGAMSAITDTARRIVGPIADAGRSASASFAAGIGLGMRIAIQAAAAGAASVVNAARANLSSLGPSGFGVGQSLGLGIAAGIGSTVGSVISAAVNLVFSAVNAAKFAAQIASPSKLMAKEIGVPLAQGVALGIDNGTGTVQHSLANLIGGLVPTSASAARMVGSQPVGAAAGGGNTVIYQTFALKSDEYQTLITNAQRGHEAQSFVEALPRSYSLVMGSR